MSGNWDYCLYKDTSKRSYVSLTWKQKHDYIMKKVRQSSKIGVYEAMKTMTESVLTSYENEWDVMPAGRLKTFHSVGAICPIKINIKSSPFTGLLKAGQIEGLIRLGPAMDFTYGCGGMMPGGAMKFLRTNVTSGNTVFLNGLNPLPDGNHDFMSVPLSNHAGDDIKRFSTNLLARKFCQIGTCNTKVGISDLCTYDQDGYKYSNPVFPFKITLKPTGQVKFSKKTPPTMEAFIHQFTRIPNHTRLYTLIASLHPWDKTGIVLGDIELTSKCVTSTYGDKKLFFRHQYIEDDVKLRPQWADAYFKDCYCNYHKRK